MYRFTRVVLANYRRLGSIRNQIDFTPNFSKIKTPTLILGFSLLEFFDSKKEEDPEKQESDLIMAIKRGKFLFHRLFY